jgi:hypothetical protein
MYIHNYTDAIEHKIPNFTANNLTGCTPVTKQRVNIALNESYICAWLEDEAHDIFIKSEKLEYSKFENIVAMISYNPKNNYDSGSIHFEIDLKLISLDQSMIDLYDPEDIDAMNKYNEYVKANSGKYHGCKRIDFTTAEIRELQKIMNQNG